jgi:hypothetical protein
MGYPVIKGTPIDDTGFRRAVQAAAPPREWMN